MPDSIMNKLYRVLYYIVIVSALLQLSSFSYMIFLMGRNTGFENFIMGLILLLTASSFLLTFPLVILRILKKLEYQHFGIVLLINTTTWFIPFLFGMMFYQMRDLAN